jgi:hypothetical protein
MRPPWLRKECARAGHREARSALILGSAPHVLETNRTQFRVACGVLDGPVPQPVLDQPRVMARIGHRIAAGMTQHMDRSSDSRSSVWREAGDRRRREGHERAAVVRSKPKSGQQHKVASCFDPWTGGALRWLPKGARKTPGGPWMRFPSSQLRMTAALPWLRKACRPTRGRVRHWPVQVVADRPVRPMAGATVTRYDALRDRAGGGDEEALPSRRRTS